MVSPQFITGPVAPAAAPGQTGGTDGGSAPGRLVLAGGAGRPPSHPAPGPVTTRLDSPYELGASAGAARQIATDLNSTNGKAEAIFTRLTKAVEKATAADQRAAGALRGDVGSSTTSFNPAPYGGGPVADANRAKDLLAKADDLTPRELKKLQDLMAANAGNKDFATTLINGLEHHGKTGQDALMEYGRIYDGLAHGKRHAHDFQAVLDGLSVSLATATHDGGTGKDWEDGLLAAARRRDGADGYNTNYPALTALMGAKGTFDKAFLLKVGNDLVDHERGSTAKGEDLWGPKWTGRPFQTDPVGGLMNALSRSPEASKDFFDPGKSRNLDYLLHERKWRDAMTPDVTGRAKPQLESLVHYSASTLGALDAVFADAALDHADADNKTVDWQAKMTYHAIGGVVGLIPEFGDAAQRLVDVGTSMWADSAKGEIDTHLKGDLSSHFSAGRQQLDAMLNYKLIESGYDHFALDGDGSVPDQLKRSAGSAYNTGIDNTYRTVFGRA
ncbi:hypothetical protein ACGF12_31770 [Kitasatospora sp. NPDC048296]|uniref:hypothetical protein n=1 Tax=Kitasatospora sp. NPDC048296 TaxID=3364048 RepID=UPI003720E2DA